MPLSPFEKCQSYVAAQVRAGRRPSGPAMLGRRPFVTISRQAGTGAPAVAEILAEVLNTGAPKGACPWTVFDRNLVDQVLKDHSLPETLADLIPEDFFAGIRDTIEEIMGLHPSSWHLVQQTSETILQLAGMGNVILVGRGAPIITRNLPNGFHVRLVGSRERRAERFGKVLHLAKAAAFKETDRVDRARQRYVQKYLRTDIGDLLLYHMVLNTDRLALDETARIIAHAVRQRLTAD